MSAADQQGSSAFLVTAPTPLGGRRFALAIVLASFVGFCALAPFARVPLPRIEAFIPIYESTLALIDLLTATLLFLAFSRSRLRAVLFLASGYLFTSLMAVPHMLTFPGLFSSSGLLGAGPQTTAWLYMFWHWPAPPPPFSCPGISGNGDLAELGRSRSSRRSCPQYQQREKRAQAEAGRNRQHADAHSIHQEAEEQRRCGLRRARRRAENAAAQPVTDRPEDRQRHGSLGDRQ